MAGFSAHALWDEIPIRNHAATVVQSMVRFSRCKVAAYGFQNKDGGKCILQLRGVRPFLSDKYDLTQHPNYKLTSDYDPKNALDIEKYLSHKEKIHPDDQFALVDVDSLPPA